MRRLVSVHVFYLLGGGHIAYWITHKCWVVFLNGRTQHVRGMHSIIISVVYYVSTQFYIPLQEKKYQVTKLLQRAKFWNPRVKFKSCHDTRSFLDLEWKHNLSRRKTLADYQGRYKPEVNQVGVSTYGFAVPELSITLCTIWGCLTSSGYPGLHDLKPLGSL